MKHDNIECLNLNVFVPEPFDTVLLSEKTSSHELDRHMHMCRCQCLYATSTQTDDRFKRQHKIYDISH